MSETKWGAVYKSLEADERSALIEKLRIEDIADSRKNVLDELLKDREALLHEINECSGERRSKAICTGDANAVSVLLKRISNLEKDCEKVQVKIESQKESYEKALQRLEAAEEELLEKRVEKKKIEKLIESADSERKIKREANLQRDTEDRNTFKNRS